MLWTSVVLSFDRCLVESAGQQKEMYSTTPSGHNEMWRISDIYLLFGSIILVKYDFIASLWIDFKRIIWKKNTPKLLFLQWLWAFSGVSGAIFRYFLVMPDNFNKVSFSDSDLNLAYFSYIGSRLSTSSLFSSCFNCMLTVTKIRPIT